MKSTKKLIKFIKSYDETNKFIKDLILPRKILCIKNLNERINYSYRGCGFVGKFNKTIFQKTKQNII